MVEALIIELPQRLLILAMLAQGAIAMVLLVWLGTIRVPLVTNRKVRVADIALSREGWPEHEKKVANAVDNQFQLPLLFYVACGLALYLRAGWLEVGLAWAFVVSRVVHATIFTTTNRVYRRFFAFTTGLGILALLWLDLAVRVLLAGGG